MLPSFCTRTVTVIRAPLVESRGARVRDWGAASTHEITGCSAQPAGTGLATGEARLATTVRLTVLMPPGSDILKGDRVLVDGLTYDIDGEPQAWVSPTGRLSHIIVNLVDWRG